MGHTPYGYRIEDGKAVIDEAAATQVRELYKNYLSGLSLTNAAKEAGLDLLHSGAKRMMRNSHYLGDDFYPAIIDKESFDAVEAELSKRSTKLGRNVTATMHQKQKGHLQPFALVTLLKITTIQSGKQNTYTA